MTLATISKNLKSLLIVFLFLLPTQEGKTAPIDLYKRYEINAKRMGVVPESEEGQAAARDFIRIDSTYYVGWMIQGLYNSDRAVDYLGFRNAILPLEKAMALIEKDYGSELRTRSSSAMELYKVEQYQKDYDQLAYNLFTAYQNTNAELESYQLLQKVAKLNRQREWRLSVYNMLFWMTHRNRIYTSAKYSFLKNTLVENEALAGRYLDSALLQIDKNAALNKELVSESYAQSQRLAVYHYKCILFSYNLQLDSANHYFALMEDSWMFPYNNHATFLSIQADFQGAMQEYEIAGSYDGGDKRLQEWAYYSSMLNIYRSKPLAAALQMRSLIKSVGSTPGFGWYNIALARACSYEGNLEDSKKYLDRAAGFKELHLGSTLGQTQYDFSVNMIGLVNTGKEIQSLKFENKSWWWQPASWYRILKLKVVKMAQRYLITNQLAANPEREQVIYKIFSTESTISWDEVWTLIEGYSNRFFYKKLETELKQDKRERVYKYYNLFLAKLDMQNGDYKVAAAKLEKILSFQEDIDPAYEQLFIARVYEALATCADENGNENAFNFYSAQFYSLYPQLSPFAEFKPQLNIQIEDPTNTVKSELEDYRINWVTDNAYAPKAFIKVSGSPGKYKITYQVVDITGKTIVAEQSILLKNLKEDVKTLAYGLFSISPLDSQADIEQAN